MRSRTSASAPQLHQSGDGGTENDAESYDSDFENGEGPSADTRGDTMEDAAAKALAQASKKSAQPNKRRVRFRRRCRQIRKLWQEMQIPNRDRRYFSKQFMAEFTERNVIFVNEQLQLMVDHRGNSPSLEPGTAAPGSNQAVVCSCKGGSCCSVWEGVKTSARWLQSAKWGRNVK